MRRVIGILGLAVLMSVPHLFAADNKVVPTVLQGRWKLVDADDSDGISKRQGFAQHIMVIKGNQMWEEPDDNEKAIPRPFKLDPTKNPKRIDFQIEGKNIGVDRFGIYKLDGDKLTICFSTLVPADESKRPNDYTIKPGTGRGLLVYERIKE